MTRLAAPTIAPRQSVGPNYKWAVVGMLWFICFFNYADRQAISSILPVLEKEYGFSKTEQGMIVSAFMWVYALTAPMAGQVSDRFPRKVVILAGLYAWSAITGFTALCTRSWQFVAVRASEGLGETFYFPASMSLVSDYHSTRTRSRAMSIHQTSVYAGTIGGGALAGWMAEHWNWQAPFLLLGGAGIVLGLILATFIREPRRNEAQLQEVADVLPAIADETTPPPTIEEAASPLPMGIFLRELAQNRTALTLAAAFFGANFVAFIFLSWMPTFLKEKFDLKLGMAGLSATLFIQVASMCGSLLGGVLADRWSGMLPGGRIAVQALGIILGAPFIFLCGWTQNMAILMGAMTLFGLFKGIYDSNIWAALYDVVPASRRSTAVGLMNMIGWFGAGLGTILIGVAVDRGMSMSVAIGSTSIIYLLVALLLLTAALVFARRDVARAHRIA
ncbi:MAG: MFS transporter [Pirellulales bacterium]|nr:MFS transporter [Pirellulales bacterium]